MSRFADGAHVAALITARPARGVIAIPVWDDMPWQASFIAALRNHCLTWGGQANLPVPWTKDAVDNPLFWRLVEAQDPDLVITAPMSWADLEDLMPARYAQQVEAWRSQLKKRGFSDPVVDRTTSERLRDPLVGRDLGVPITKQLIDRMGLLHWRDHIETTVSLASSPASGACVDVRKFWAPSSSIHVTRPVCEGSWDERLAICALLGDISPLLRTELYAFPNVIIQDEAAEPGFSAIDLVHSPPRRPGDWLYPFQLTEIGLQWGRIGGGYDEGQVVVVAGDDPWDFALFYALRRLMSRAYWMPLPGQTTS